jgi:VWFA-related protein
VAGLTKDHFAIDDNGVAQRLDVIELKDTPVSVLFALDTSASVEGDKLARLTAAAAAAVASLGPQDRAAVLTFSQRPRLVMPFSQPGSTLAALSSFSGAGGTALYDAMFSAIRLPSTIAGRTLIIAFSDGYDSASWLDPRDVVATARRSDLVLHAVTLQPDVRTADDLLRINAGRLLFQEEPHLMAANFLTELTDATGGALVHAESNNLRETFIQLVNEFRNRYVLTFVPTGVPTTGWHTLNVKVRGSGLRVQSRKGYLR